MASCRALTKIADFAEAETDDELDRKKADLNTELLMIVFEYTRLRQVFAASCLQHFVARIGTDPIFESEFPQKDQHRLAFFRRLALPSSVFTAMAFNLKPDFGALLMINQPVTAEETLASVSSKELVAYEEREKAKFLAAQRAKSSRKSADPRKTHP